MPDQAAGRGRDPGDGAAEAHPPFRLATRDTRHPGDQFELAAASVLPGERVMTEAGVGAKSHVGGGADPATIHPTPHGFQRAHHAECIVVIEEAELHSGEGGRDEFAGLQ
ncbi:hypothetical protein [Cryobacterium psychrophilum]|uniref:hypothetical protein n=1 Tax=Cryobacterium psychrophilum TaxID=41988 RepID=UPI00106570B0|nr:hypothetical protein [Cryobacterium psychrophilum]